jgi:hypothetical protein
MKRARPTGVGPIDGAALPRRALDRVAVFFTGRFGQTIVIFRLLIGRCRSLPYDLIQISLLRFGA